MITLRNVLAHDARTFSLSVSWIGKNLRSFPAALKDARCRPEPLKTVLTAEPWTLPICRDQLLIRHPLRRSIGLSDLTMFARLTSVRR
jgi:hypothetical protein